MRLAPALLALVVTPALAFADPAPVPAAPAVPSTAAASAKPAAAKATCKRKLVGKGLDRHSVCEIEGPILVNASSKPAVAIVSQDPRKLVGRPRSSDRLDGLSHQLRP